MTIGVRTLLRRERRAPSATVLSSLKVGMDEFSLTPALSRWEREKRRPRS